MGLPHWAMEAMRRLGEATYQRVIPLARRVAGRVVKTDTLRAVLNPTSGYGPPDWSEAWSGRDRQPLMQVHSVWTFTNLTQEPLQIATAYLRIKERPHGAVFLIDPRREGPGPRLLPPGVPLDGTLHIMFGPPVRKPGQDLKATVVFVDNLGNEIPVHGVRFRGPRRKN